MQKHFNNAHYMDSKKFPKIKFVGKITNLSAVDLSKNGTYNVTVAGNMTIRGTAKPQTANGTLTVEGGVIKGFAEFTVKNIGDYGVGKPKNKKKKSNTFKSFYYRT